MYKVLLERLQKKVLRSRNCALLIFTLYGGKLFLSNPLWTDVAVLAVLASVQAFYGFLGSREPRDEKRQEDRVQNLEKAVTSLNSSVGAMGVAAASKSYWRKK